jgi:hypothetical protein
MTDTHEHGDEHHHHELTYYVNNEPEHTEHHELKVKTILENAELKPFNEWQLIRDHPHHKFTDYDEEVHLHEDERFTATFIGPTPTS